jgi:hypothetical protein
MYLMGKGHTHYGPGTSFVQRIDWTRPEEMRMEGMGCAGCGCQNCRGLGLFESGFDVSGWGPLEIGIVALGGYMLLSTIFTTGRAVSAVRAYPGKRRSKKAARLRAQALELTRKRK